MRQYMLLKKSFSSSNSILLSTKKLNKILFNPFVPIVTIGSHLCLFLYNQMVELQDSVSPFFNVGYNSPLTLGLCLINVYNISRLVDFPQCFNSSFHSIELNTHKFIKQNIRKKNIKGLYIQYLLLRLLHCDHEIDRCRD